MIDSTIPNLVHDSPVLVKANSRSRDDASHRLLAVIAGGVEFLLRPEFLRNVYTIPADCMSSNLSYVPTPDGVLQTVSLAERMVSDMGFVTDNYASERTIIVFQRGSRMVALRVHSVSRPVEVKQQDLFPLPPLAHPRETVKFVDSIVVHAQESDLQKQIGFVINPLVLLGFDDNAITLSSRNVLGDNAGSIAREQKCQIAQKRNNAVNPSPSQLANLQLLAFCPQTPLPSHLFFRFCLPMSAIAEARFDEPYTSLPTASSVLRGFLMWRSKPVPVIDLAKAFGASEDESCQPQPGRILIVVLPTGQLVALPAESGIQTKRAPKATSFNYPAIANYPHIGAFPDGSEVLVIPDLNRILNLN